MTKLKRIFKFLLFVALLVLILARANEIVTPKWAYTMDTEEAGEGTRLRDFYKMEEGSLDYAVLGVSHAYYSVNPMQVYAETGFTGYNLSGSYQPQSCSYYWLLEAEKYHNLKCVFMDVSSLLKDSGAPEQITKSLVGLRFSPLKLEAIKNCSPDEETVYTSLFPLYGFHERWEDLKREDFAGPEQENYYYLRGAALRYFAVNEFVAEQVGGREYIELTPKPDGEAVEKIVTADFNNEQRFFFEKICAYCKEKGIELICVKFPTRAWNHSWSEDVRAYLKTLNLDLIDLSDGSAIGIDWDKDTHDNGSHLNYSGCCKTSHFVAELLKEKGLLKDHRGEAGYERWDKDLVSYRDWDRDNALGRLHPELELYRYLSILAENKERLLVILSGHHDVSEYENPEMDSLARCMGLKDGLGIKYQQSYLALIDGGKQVFRHTNDKRLVYEGEFTAENGEKLTLRLTSSGSAAGIVNDLKVNDRDYSFAREGLNILVLDKRDGRVLSRARYGIDNYGALRLQKENPSEEAADIWRELSGFKDGEYLMTPLSGGEEPVKVRISNLGNDCVNITLLDGTESLQPFNEDNAEGSGVGFSYAAGLSSEDWVPFIAEETGVPNGGGEKRKLWRFDSLYSGLSLTEDKSVKEGGDSTRGGNYTQMIFENSDRQLFYLEDLD